MAGHMDKMGSDDIKRHFPAGGKGDCLFRGRLGKHINNEKQANYKANAFWDNCEFEKKKRQKIDNDNNNVATECQNAVT